RGPDHRQCNIAAQEKIRAMGKIDDTHDAEDEREPAAQQKQERAVRHAVEGLNQPESRIHPLGHRLRCRVTMRDNASRGSAYAMRPSLPVMVCAAVSALRMASSVTSTAASNRPSM